MTQKSRLCLSFEPYSRISSALFVPHQNGGHYSFDREVDIEIGMLQQANGSAQVSFKTCGTGTVVVAAVKAEIISLDAATDTGNTSHKQSSDAVQTSATITAAALANLSKQQKSTLETTIAAVLRRTFLAGGAMDVDKVLWHTQPLWCLASCQMLIVRVALLFLVDNHSRKVSVGAVRGRHCDAK